MPRDGLAEMAPDDRARMARRSIIFEGVKKAAEYAGLRQQRFILHNDGAAPADSKVLIIVRHGEGMHNAWRAAEKAAGRTPTAKRHNRGEWPEELHDPLLTERGVQDALTAAAAARQLEEQPTLLVTSPMRRAVQTLMFAFGDASAAGVPIVAHELCREAFHGTDPSVYDSRLARSALQNAFPQVDFTSHVLEPEPPSNGVAAAVDESAAVDDPLWWHCSSPFGHVGPRGVDEAAIGEHAYRFLEWLMGRPERVIAVATHSNFALALYHACLDGAPDTPQVLHTGELRALTVSAVDANLASTPAGATAAAGRGGLPRIDSRIFDEAMRGRAEERPGGAEPTVKKARR